MQDDFHGRKLVDHGAGVFQAFLALTKHTCSLIHHVRGNRVFARIFREVCNIATKNRKILGESANRKRTVSSSPVAYNDGSCVSLNENALHSTCLCFSQ